MRLISRRTGLLLSLLGKLEGRQSNVLLLDTFDGIPETSRLDNSRSIGEFAAPRTRSRSSSGKHRSWELVTESRSIGDSS